LTCIEAATGEPTPAKPKRRTSQRLHAKMAMKKNANKKVASKK
jgi:hypothetical protein